LRLIQTTTAVGDKASRRYDANLGTITIRKKFATGKLDGRVCWWYRFAQRQS